MLIITGIYNDSNTLKSIYQYRTLVTDDMRKFCTDQSCL